MVDGTINTGQYFYDETRDEHVLRAHLHTHDDALELGKGDTAAYEKENRMEKLAVE